MKLLHNVFIRPTGLDDFDVVLADDCEKWWSAPLQKHRYNGKPNNLTLSKFVRVLWLSTFLTQNREIDSKRLGSVENGVCVKAAAKQDAAPWEYEVPYWSSFEGGQSPCRDFQES
jgi:hypothetical protein